MHWQSYLQPHVNCFPTGCNTLRFSIFDFLMNSLFFTKLLAAFLGIIFVLFVPRLVFLYSIFSEHCSFAKLFCYPLGISVLLAVTRFVFSIFDFLLNNLLFTKLLATHLVSIFAVLVPCLVFLYSNFNGQLVLYKVSCCPPIICFRARCNSLGIAIFDFQWKLLSKNAKRYTRNAKRYTRNATRLILIYD